MLFIVGILRNCDILHAAARHAMTKLLCDPMPSGWFRAFFLQRTTLFYIRLVRVIRNRVVHGSSLQRRETRQSRKPSSSRVTALALILLRHSAGKTGHLKPVFMPERLMNGE